MHKNKWIPYFLWCGFLYLFWQTDWQKGNISGLTASPLFYFFVFLLALASSYYCGNIAKKIGPYFRMVYLGPLLAASFPYAGSLKNWHILTGYLGILLFSLGSLLSFQIYLWRQEKATIYRIYLDFYLLFLAMLWMHYAVINALIEFFYFLLVTVLYRLMDRT